MELTGFFYESTGFSGLRYYRNETPEEVYLDACSLVLPVLDADIRIEGLHFQSSFDLDTTLVPGMKRVIFLEENGLRYPAAEIVLEQDGTCRIVTADGCCYVREDDAGYTFYPKNPQRRKSDPIAVLTRITESSFLPAFYDEIRPGFAAKVNGDAPVLMKMAMLSYPALKYI